jgi:hypothetical protein
MTFCIEAMPDGRNSHCEISESTPGAARVQGPGAVVVPARFSRTAFPLRCLRFLLFKIPATRSGSIEILPPAFGIKAKQDLLTPGGVNKRLAAGFAGCQDAKTLSRLSVSISAIRG